MERVEQFCSTFSSERKGIDGMDRIKPTALKYGDTIGIVAPASPTEADQVILTKEKVEALGFRVKMGRSCYEKHGYLAGTDDVRARDLNNMFLDKGVDGILCLRGGYGTPKILNQLDYDGISRNPKVFIGYSDITALHIAINQKCELITFHGPMGATEIAKDLDSFTKESLLKNIMEPLPYGDIKNPEGMKIRPLVGGKGEGIITGGNLTLICSTLGTPYEIDTKDKLLFLEDIEEEPYGLDRYLTQLALAGKLQQAAGFILGNWKDCVASNPDRSLTLQEIFKEILIPYNKPTVYNVMAGHCSPMITMPLGVRACIDGDYGAITILEQGTSAKGDRG